MTLTAGTEEPTKCSLLINKMCIRDRLESFVEDKAKLWVDFGKIFGRESGQFIRRNIACPGAVSYTHLDVYKRQGVGQAA